MAKVFLTKDEIRENGVVSDDLVYGESGIEGVLLAASAANVANVKFDQNVEQVGLPGIIASYAFLQAGNNLRIYSGETLVATVVLQDDEDGTLITFANGTVEALLTGRVMTLGGVTVSPDGKTPLEIPAEDIDPATPTNEAPVLTSGGDAAVAENNAAGTIVYTATATDANPGDTVAFSLGGTDAAFFAINSGSGEVALTAPADFETKNSYAITVIATDAGGLTASKAVTVNIANVNEAPVMTSGATATVTENAPVSAILYTASATDIDSGDTLAYSLGGADAALFNINATTGVVTLKSPANYEAKSSYALNVIATDTGGLTGSKAVTIGVTNVNEAPAITSDPLVFVDENLPASTVVYTATASDADAGDTKVFSLGTALDEEFFAINAATGAVTFKNPADYDKDHTYVIRVFATDAAGLDDGKSVTVEVNDVNDVPVITSAATATVAENIPVSTVVYTVTNQVFNPAVKATFSIDGTDAAAFAINANTGAVTFKSSPDFETKAKYEFNVIATDTAGETSKAVTINVTNVNEAPAINSPNTGMILENAPVSTVVYTVAATDSDSADSVTYSLGGPDADLFNITREGGFVTFKNPSDFETWHRTIDDVRIVYRYPEDAEVRKLYDIDVIATDASGLTDTKIVTILVNDANDNAPVITTSPLQAVPENTTLVAALTSTDVDTVGTNPETFSITGGIDADKFRIIDGNLHFKAEPDYEAPGSANPWARNEYKVEVAASDDVNSSRKTITIDVTDANEAPVITSGATATVAENAATSTLIYTATATDVDALDTRTFSLGGDDAGFFTIDAANGEVSLNSPADFEAKTSYVIDVIATDAGGLTGSKAVTVTVTDVNEAPPYIYLSATSIAENNEAGATVATLIVNDPDSFESGFAAPFTYALVPGYGDTDNAAFTIVDDKLTMNAPADYETKQTYVFRLQVTDNGGLTCETFHSVSVTDVNDNAPVITTNAALGVDENTPILVPLTSTDVDTVGTNPATFTISGGDDAALFAIDGYGNLTLAAQDFEAPADADSNNTYLVQVTANDGINTSNKTIMVTVDNVDITTLIGTAGNDTFSYSASTENFIIKGLENNDTITTGSGNDILRGGAGVDIMDGGAGDDIFVVVGDLSAGGKVDSAEDTAALGFPLTDLNGQDLNEDQDGSAEVIIGGEGDDTLFIYGTADLSNYDISGIEHIEIRSEVTFSQELLEQLQAKGDVTIFGDGSSFIRLDGGTAVDPLIVDLTAADALMLGNIGQISLGEHVILRIASLDQLGGARILTGNGVIEATGAPISLPSTYTIEKYLTLENVDKGDAVVLNHVIHARTGETTSGTGSDDYLIGTAYNDTFDCGNGNDVMSGKDGNDTFIISGSGTKTILDSKGTDTLDLSGAASGANIDLSSGGTAGGATILLGSGSGATNNLPLDLFITEDLSGSFGDDVATVRSLLDDLIVQVKEIQPNTYFGAGSFVDKPMDPFGDPRGDYVYLTNSKLSSNEADVKAAFDAMSIHSGNDGPEAQLEALYQIALRTIADDATGGTAVDEIGFRSDAMRVVVLTTDAPYHVAGDNAGAGPNNGDIVLDGSPAGTGEDYPTIAQLKTALEKASIYPVFATTEPWIYQELVDQLGGRGASVGLTSNSSDLINSITTGLANYKTDFIENLVGTDYSDTLGGNTLANSINGGKGNDILTGFGGDDTLRGGDDYDVAVFSGNLAGYTLKSEGDVIIVSGIDGVDNVYNDIETLRFADMDYHLSAVSFNAKDQSYWVDGAASKFEFTYDGLAVTMPVNIPEFEIGPDYDSFAAQVGGTASGSVDFSLPLSLSIDTGGFDLNNYLVNSLVAIPNGVAAGSTFTVNTGMAGISAVDLTLNNPLPSFNFKLDVKADFSDLDGNVWSWLKFNPPGEPLDFSQMLYADTKDIPNGVYQQNIIDYTYSSDEALISEYETKILNNFTIGEKELGPRKVYRDSLVDININKIDLPGSVVGTVTNDGFFSDISGIFKPEDPTLVVTLDVDDTLGKILELIPATTAIGVAIRKLDGVYRMKTLGGESLENLPLGDGILGDIATSVASDLGLKIDEAKNTVDVATDLYYGILGLEASVSASPVVKFTFDVQKVGVTLESSWGEEFSGLLGDSFAFHAPADGIDGATITSSYSLGGTLNANLGIQFNAGYAYSVLGADGKLLGYDLPDSFFALHEENLTAWSSDPIFPDIASLSRDFNFTAIGNDYFLV